MPVYRKDNQHLLNPLTDFDAAVVRPSYNTRAARLSDHELVLARIPLDNTLCCMWTYNLLEQMQLCPGGYYNNPWRATEDIDSALHRQQRALARLHAAISAETDCDMHAVALQECEVPTAELGFDPQQWTLARSGSLVCSVRDINAHVVPYTLPEPPRSPLTTSDGDRRLLIVYSPRTKTMFCAVHLKWLAKENTAGFALLVEHIQHAMSHKVPECESVVLFGDFNTVSYAVPGLRLTPDIRTLINSVFLIRDPIEYYGITSYTNVHNEPDADGNDRELCTTSDYIFVVDVPASNV